MVSICARVVLVNTEDDEETVTLDLLVTKDGMPNTRAPNFGTVYSPLSDNALPFILRPSGTLYYGAQAAPGQVQEEKLNVFQPGRKIEIGALFTFSRGEDEWVYKVKAVTDLSTL
jgi:hypothetical protein